MKRTLSPVSFKTLSLISLTFPLVLLNTIALGETASQTPTQEVAKVDASTLNNDEMVDVVSDGSPFDIKKLGISFRPPVGWNVATKVAGLSVVMSEPKPPIKVNDYETPVFQRNITVAAMHEASPIDEKRAVILQKQLIDAFAKDAMVSNFTVLEHKLFNYRGTNDGLLVYSSLQMGEFKMMQMHVLVSGKMKQFLMTYTDLEDRFRAEGPAGYETAWQSMMSLEVTGHAPKRYESLVRYGSIGGGFLFLLAVIGLIRRRSITRDYMKDADVIYRDDDDASISNVEFSHVSAISKVSRMSNIWNLSSSKKMNEEDAEDMDADVDYEDVDEAEMDDDEDEGHNAHETKDSSIMVDDEELRCSSI